jgi:predicted amidohydrolase
MSNATRKGSFRVGLIAMRSVRRPDENLQAASKLIEQAKHEGADYVLTPEMTNIMELSRDALFSVIASEEQDTTLAGFRLLARKLRLYIHVGSLAIKVSPDKAANRSYLIDPKGDILARYDKIHMFDVDLAGGVSYRESRTYRPGEIAVTADLPWGTIGLTVCYDLRFPALYRALAEAGASSSPFPPLSPGRPARRIGMCLCARGRSKTAVMSSPPRRAASTRTGARHSATR